MLSDSDTYTTIVTPSEEILFKEKKSKFYAYAFPLTAEQEVKPIIEGLRKKHHTANHVCYAWQLGVEKMKYRANDDGEPNNSAGMPIYGQIQSLELTNILVAVVRVFGGTKLGIGGLVSAYKTAAQLSLEQAIIVEKIVQEQFQLLFEYADMDKVMRIIKHEQIDIVSQTMALNCNFVLSVRKRDFDKTIHLFKEIHTITVHTFDT